MILNPNTKVSNIIGEGSGQVEASQVSVVGFSGQAYEVQTIVSAAFASTAQADYFVLEDTAGQSFAVWLDKDDAGTAPTGAAYVASDFQREVDIVTGDTDAQVAGKIKTAIEADSNFDGFTLSINSATITFTQELVGPVTAPAVHDASDAGAGSFVGATVTQGLSPSLNSKYILLSSDSTDYYVWANVNGAGVDPMVASRTGVEVALTGEESSDEICDAYASAITALAGITCTADGSRLLISSDSKEDILNTTAGDSGLSLDIKAQGYSAILAPASSVGLISNNPSALSDPS